MTMTDTTPTAAKPAGRKTVAVMVLFRAVAGLLAPLGGYYGRRATGVSIYVAFFSKPLLQGRLRWPDNFAQLWATSSRWQRMWRVSSVLFGIGMLADAVLRVVFAYTLPADVVPALATGLYAATSLLLIVVTNAYYLLCGVQNRRSALFEKDLVG
ncbi:MAG: hypothetical protein ABJD68_06175 [Nakamurella sp.]